MEPEILAPSGKSQRARGRVLSSAVAVPADKRRVLRVLERRGRAFAGRWGNSGGGDVGHTSDLAGARSRRDGGEWPHGGEHTIGRRQKMTRVVTCAMQPRA